MSNTWKQYCRRYKMCPMNSLKKTHLLGIFWSILVVWNSEWKYQLIITISWQELSALVYGHRAWHGASCEEEKREEFVHAAWHTFEKRKKLFMKMYVHCTKGKEKISYIVQASSMLQGFPCPGTTEPIHSSSQGNQKGDKKNKTKRQNYNPMEK